MKKYGLIGRKLGHSLSQELFEAQGFKDASYGLYEMESLDRLRQWVEQEHINGFNVTIPYTTPMHRHSNIHSRNGCRYPSYHTQP